MTDIFEQLKKARQSISFDAQKKSETRHFLEVFMDTHASQESDVSMAGFPRHIPQRSLVINSVAFKPMMAGLMIALLLSGGVSFAAENSLPGDALYPVKVGVNEEVKGAFTLGAEAKAKWEARRAERRLEEAEALAEADSNVNVEVLARIEANFETHADRVKERIERFEAEAKADVAARVAEKFEMSLRAHEGILAKLAERRAAATAVFGASATSSAEAGATTSVEADAEGEARTHVRPLHMKVREHLLEISARRAELKATAETKSNNEGDEGKEESDEEESSAEIEAEGEAEASGSGVKVEGSGSVKVGL